MIRIGRNEGNHGPAAASTVLLIAGLLLATPSAIAQICQTPLFIQEGAVEANVMVLFDNSGSMNEAMYHPAFDPNIAYTGGFTATSMYYVGTTGWYNFNGRSGYLVRSYNQQGRYIGAYLNWIFWHASEDERDNIPRVTRIQVAHEVVSDIISRSSRVRFGLAIFNLSNGGQVIAPCGTSKDDLVWSVNHIEGTTWTPLAETMEDVLDYFKDDDGGAPIQASCQQNFLIVMTDGFPTQDTDVSFYLHDADGDGNDPGNCASIGAPYDNGNACSDHMDDVAYWARHNDLRDDLGTPGESWEEGQNLVTYTVGFGIDAGLLWETAHNGDGIYLLAENASELWLSLELIMLDIISRISTGAAVAVVSTERGTDDRLFRGKFMPGTWAGFLESFNLPYENGDSPMWEAGWQLVSRSAADRDIYTAIGTTWYDFTQGQASNLRAAMGVATPEIASDVIRWTRGDDGYPYRDREQWKLGDIIHSTPVVVGPPTAFCEDEDFQEFMANNSNRTRMVYVGANDGMLHAFRADSGHEDWAFVPEFTLPMLDDIADTNYCHLYAVDQTPSVADIKVNGAWRTVLVCGGREGGHSYFALDVTSPSAPSIMWQVDLPNGADFSSEAQFATIDGQAVVLIGSGLDTILGEAWLYEYDLATGALLGELYLSQRAGSRNKTSAPRTVDLNLDGETDLGYVADLDGTIWRLDFNESTNPGSWDASMLYSGAREITSPPVPAFGENGNVHVYFGTGAYLESEDIHTLGQNTFFCVIDRHDGAENPSLVDQSGSIQDIGDADGWYYNLQEADGERVTEPAAVVAGSVFFTTFVPSAELCEAGGRSWLYRMSYDDGSVPDDGEEDGFGGDRVMALDEGIASRAVVDIVNETVIVQSSDATITVQDIGQTFFHLNVRAWQESFDFVEEAPPPEL